MAAAEAKLPLPSLKDELAAALPKGFNSKIRYIHSPAKQCDPLFSAPPGHQPEKTRSSSHFLTVSVDAASIFPNEVPSGPKDVISFAIEVLVYKTRHLTTIFVSKVDSTSYIPRQRPSPVKTTVTTFLRWLAGQERQRRPKRKIVLSLFARAQAAYLFPGSADDKSKHVLDDRQLIKWWARVLDPIIPKEAATPTDDLEVSFQGYITVPGYAGNELKRSFMPPSDSTDAKPRWLAGHPLLELGHTRGVPEHAPPRCFLPRFPDDPKARYIQDLDDEIGMSEDSQTQSSPSKRGKSGMWKSVRDLDRFWEAMEFRQECSSGRVVGFLWLVISPKQSDADLPDADMMSVAANIDSQDGLTTAALQSHSSDPPSQPDNTGSPKKRKRKPLTGLIIPRAPRLKGGSSSQSGLSELVDAEQSGDNIVISEEGYDKVMQTMLHLDFSTLQAAIRSTKRWIAEVTSVCGLNGDFAVEIAGLAQAEIVPLPAVATANGSTQGEVNDLGGMVRKKRKVEEGQSQASAERTETAMQPAVNMLGGGLIRKKAKPKPDA